ncbi:exodeoxyribonuclease V subunit gamma [Aliidiomarina sp.]|uniref:exodeoxyribonuclease V subunit gamma n=1 Tax=Aliidiomarina sp. TaxID=1872439 RepID=UPI003A4DA55F
MSLTPGFIVLHGNQLESLRSVLVHWMSSQPISPLADEQILVQSNGIAQWLKMALASTEDGHPGIAAGVRVELPNQFVWRLYRMVLGQQIPASLPYDKNNLTWRILRLLPRLTTPVFAPLQRYLSDDENGRKSYHLAARLADLYDQYQVYRADWLQHWSEGRDVLSKGAAVAGEHPLTTEQCWQPALWRALRADLAAESAGMEFSSRADVHDQALNLLKSGDIAEAELPERVIVFGISSLPKQTLELLAALGQHTQVLLAVLNPCRHFWGEIASVRDEARRRTRSNGRQEAKPGLPEVLDSDALYLHAPALLASLGKQARDYLSLLEEFDQPEQYQTWFSAPINVFMHPATGEYAEQGEGPTELAQFPLLHQLQQDIFDLNPPATAQNKRALQAGDESLTFHRCHSRQREVEVLQDNLLAAFAADETLRPRDVIVMTPDIADYAPHINAVFGRIERDDWRYLPFSLADQANRGRVPMLIALEYLLSLPEQRVTLNEVFDLLDVPAIQQRLQLQPAVLPQLRLWLTEAGVRWGIDGEHRQVFALQGMGDAYSWAFGIERMLLGYAFGEPCVSSANELADASWHERMPYAEIGGLSAADLGPVLQFIQQLKRWTTTLAAQPLRSFADWQALFSGENNLLDTFFLPDNDADERLFVQLQEALERIASAVAAGDFNGELSLAVLRDAWLAEADQSGLSQKFMAGKITFSTLLPMRAIPFKRVYVLGMNDGEYPRSKRADDFDLMSNDYRPGDRSRRDDDRYLFLEALLSAREALYLSWIGRSDRDNTEKTASVLVNQLRDLISQGWHGANQGSNKETAPAEHGPLALITHDYPLQPFSRAYFDGTQRTYAREWEQLHAVHEKPLATADTNHLPTMSELPELTLPALQQFLRNPVRYFIAERFRARDYQDELILDDNEPFALDGLQAYSLRSKVLDQLMHNPQRSITSAIQSLRAEGVLPFATFGALAEQSIRREVQVVLSRVADDQQNWQPAQEPLRIELHPCGLALSAELDQYYIAAAGEAALVLARPTAVRNKGKPRWENLLDAWLQQLVANAAGHALQVWQYGLDSKVVLPAKSQQEAQEQLQQLVTYWQAGLQQPLPLARKTAFALLAEKKPYEVVATYEGSFSFAGEVSHSAELARYFPTYAVLEEAGFAVWAERLYGPISNSTEVEQ